MRKYGLSGNMLKWIAAFFMAVDHVGVILFPEWRILRMLGRLSFPIFAFMIAEGCRYTRNKYRYFLGIFGVGVVCQAALFFYNGSTEMNILLTFSLSILLVYAFAFLKEQLFAWERSVSCTLAALVLFVLLLAGVVLLGKILDLDYDATGCMVPLYASLLHPPRKRADTALHRIDRPCWHVLSMTAGLLLLSADHGGIQWLCLLALPILLLYTGKRGKARMKYFFYIFYPAHLLVIEGIAWLLR